MFSSALKSFSSNITANYTLSSNPSAIAGAWRVFDGKNKKTGKAVSVFVFDRKSLEPPGGGGSLRGRSDGASWRKIHDEVVERLKKEASSLARLRHPSVLELAEPVEDTRNGGLMFATEPVTTTLAGLLQSEDEREKGRSRASQHYGDSSTGQKEAQIDELEIQKGLLQVAKGLEFLHESAGLVHGNLTPESIYINQKGDWKLSGMAFSGPPDTSPFGTASSPPPIALSELLYYDPRLPKTVQLNLDYTSPDFVMDANISSGADMFSFGLLILSLYNTPHESPLQTSSNVSAYKKIFGSPSTVPMGSNNYLCQKSLPRDLVSEVLPRLITRRPAQRMSAREFQQSAFFDNILVSSIRFLDSFPAKTSNEKSQFLRGLPRVLDQFPKSVLDKKVLPLLLEETKDKELLALILGDVFKIVALSQSRERLFSDRILPKLREVFLSGAGKGGTPERDAAKEAGLAMVLEHMPLLAENCTGKSFKDDVLPLVQMGLESHTHAIVDKALNCLSKILPILDFSTIKNELFPAVATVFSKTSSMAIKIRGLQALALLCGGGLDTKDMASSKSNSSTVLDKYTVQEKVVPLVKAIKTKEPTVMMAALKVLRQIGVLVDADFLAMEVLPILWSFSLGPLLNLVQFQSYMEVIRQFSKKIEQDQTRKLKDLASNSANAFDDSAQSTDLMSTNATDLFSMPASTSSTDFERLVLGKGSISASSQPNTSLANPFAAHPGSPASPSPSSLWSSNAGAFATSQSSRAVTPDSSLSSMAALPSRPSQPSLQPALQPMAPTNPWASPPPSYNAPTGASAASNPWASPPQANGGWGRPAVAQSSYSMSNIATINATNGINAKPMQRTQNAAGTNGFFLAPPPGADMGTNVPKAGNPNQEKKSGLDAYESLI